MIPERETALKEKKDAITAVQAKVEAEMAKQRQLEKELEHIRSLEPKASLEDHLLPLTDSIVISHIASDCRCLECPS